MMVISLCMRDREQPIAGSEMNLIEKRTDAKTALECNALIESVADECLAMVMGKLFALDP